MRWWWWGGSGKCGVILNEKCSLYLTAQTSRFNPVITVKCWYNQIQTSYLKVTQAKCNDVISYTPTSRDMDCFFFVFFLLCILSFLQWHSILHIRFHWLRLCHDASLRTVVPLCVSVWESVSVSERASEPEIYQLYLKHIALIQPTKAIQIPPSWEMYHTLIQYLYNTYSYQVFDFYQSFPT